MLKGMEVSHVVGNGGEPCCSIWSEPCCRVWRLAML